MRGAGRRALGSGSFLPPSVSSSPASAGSCKRLRRMKAFILAMLTGRDESAYAASPTHPSAPVVRTCRRAAAWAAPSSGPSVTCDVWREHRRRTDDKTGSPRVPPASGSRRSPRCRIPCRARGGADDDDGHRTGHGPDRRRRGPGQDRPQDRPSDLRPVRRAPRHGHLRRHLGRARITDPQHPRHPQRRRRGPEGDQGAQRPLAGRVLRGRVPLAQGRRA